MAKKKDYIVPEELIEKLKLHNYQESANKEAIGHIMKFLGELKKEQHETWIRVYESVGLDPIKEIDRQKWGINLITGKLTRIKDEGKKGKG